MKKFNEQQFLLWLCNKNRALEYHANDSEVAMRIFQLSALELVCYLGEYLTRDIEE